MCTEVTIHGIMTDSYLGVSYYENFKPNDPQVDKEFSDHQYAVVRHEVTHKPGINGMVTIKVCMHNYKAFNFNFIAILYCLQ